MRSYKYKFFRASQFNARSFKQSSLFKSVIHNQFLDSFYRLMASSIFLSFPNHYYKSRIKSVCFFTGRSRGNFSKLNFSRISFKQYAGIGYLSGYRSSKW
jgi:ribosomal protein S14